MAKKIIIILMLLPSILYAGSRYNSESHTSSYTIRLVGEYGVVPSTESVTGVFISSWGITFPDGSTLPSSITIDIEDITGNDGLFRTTHTVEDLLGNDGLFRTTHTVEDLIGKDSIFFATMTVQDLVGKDSIFYSSDSYKFRVASDTLINFPEWYSLMKSSENYKFRVASDTLVNFPEWYALMKASESFKFMSASNTLVEISGSIEDIAGNDGLLRTTHTVEDIIGNDGLFRSTGGVVSGTINILAGEVIINSSFTINMILNMNGHDIVDVDSYTGQALRIAEFEFTVNSSSGVCNMPWGYDGGAFEYGTVSAPPIANVGAGSTYRDSDDAYHLHLATSDINSILGEGWIDISAEGALTPWTSQIDGDDYDLIDVSTITINGQYGFTEGGGFFHQDASYLRLEGNDVVIGNAGGFSKIDGDGDLGVEDELEILGRAHFIADAWFYSYIRFDTEELGIDFKSRFGIVEHGGTNNSLNIHTKVNNAAYSGNFVFAERDDYHAISAPLMLNPTIRIYKTDGINRENIYMHYGSTEAYIGTEAGYLIIDSSNTAAGLVRIMDDTEIIGDLTVEATTYCYGYIENRSPISNARDYGSQSAPPENNAPIYSSYKDSSDGGRLHIATSTVNTVLGEGWVGVKWESE